MADALKKAAVWLGLVSDNTYAQSEYGVDDVTQQVARDAETGGYPAPPPFAG